MRVLVDTNILARLAQPNHRQYQAALQAVEQALARNDDACIVPQVVYELWVIATRPTANNGLGLSVAQAQSELTKIRRFCSLLRDERAVFQEWERLVVEHDVKGKSAHDARLVAAMHRHGLTHILTFNAEDFTRYPDITVIVPKSNLHSAPP